jgi:hypothetical protein
VIFKSRQSVFVLIYVTLHVIDLILKVFGVVIECLTVLHSFLGFAIGLRCLNLVLFNELHELGIVTL